MTGLINNFKFEAFEGWDAMFELIKQQRGPFQHCSTQQTRTLLKARRLLRYA